MTSGRTALTVVVLVAIGAAVLGASMKMPRAAKPLRVCADPNNLPYSNKQGEGFENHLASLVAGELGRPVSYTWWAQRRGFLRSTLKDSLCDVVMGVPSSIEMVRRTKPYYRSTYVFVSRRNRHLDLRSLDDTLLRHLRIGVPMVGDDYASTPPAAAMIKRGLAKNLVSYSVYGDYSTANPPARIIDAVANGDVDIAIAWGPLAGYFAKQSKTPLEITPVTPDNDGALRFAFDVSLGVRKKDHELRDQLDMFVTNHREEINGILDGYNVPRVAPEAQLTRAK